VKGEGKGTKNPRGEAVLTRTHKIPSRSRTVSDAPLLSREGQRSLRMGASMTGLPGDVDRARRDRWRLAVHGPGAGRGEAGRCANGPLGPGRDPLRDAEGEAGVGHELRTGREGMDMTTPAGVLQGLKVIFRWAGPIGPARPLFRGWPALERRCNSPRPLASESVAALVAHREAVYRGRTLENTCTSRYNAR